MANKKKTNKIVSEPGVTKAVDPRDTQGRGGGLLPTSITESAQKPIEESGHIDPRVERYNTAQGWNSFSLPVVAVYAFIVAFLHTKLGAESIGLLIDLTLISVIAYIGIITINNVITASCKAHICLALSLLIFPTTTLLANIFQWNLTESIANWVNISVAISGIFLVIGLILKFTKNVRREK